MRNIIKEKQTTELMKTRSNIWRHDSKENSMGKNGTSNREEKDIWDNRRKAL